MDFFKARYKKIDNRVHLMFYSPSSMDCLNNHYKLNNDTLMQFILDMISDIFIENKYSQLQNAIKVSTMNDSRFLLERVLGLTCYEKNKDSDAYYLEFSFDENKDGFIKMLKAERFNIVITKTETLKKLEEETLDLKFDYKNELELVDELLRLVKRSVNHPLVNQNKIERNVISTDNLKNIKKLYKQFLEVADIFTETNYEKTIMEKDVIKKETSKQNNSQRKIKKF